MGAARPTQAAPARAAVLRADTRRVLVELVERGCRVRVTADGTIHIVDDPTDDPFADVDYTHRAEPKPRAPRKDQAVIPRTVRAEVIARDGKVCRYCGTTEGPFHLDHIVAASRGGPSTADNLTVACAACNWSKRAMSLDDWKARR